MEGTMRAAGGWVPTPGGAIAAVGMAEGRGELPRPLGGAGSGSGAAPHRVDIIYGGPETEAAVSQCDTRGHRG